MSKPVKNGWFRHRGGKCPVKAGTLVDVRYRIGRVNEHVAALAFVNAGGSIEGFKAVDWSHAGVSLDIMSYRIHKPDEESFNVVEATGGGSFKVGDKVVFHQADKPVDTAFPFDQKGPIQWRDRIREIDAQSVEMAKERAELVNRLADEGFSLIDQINAQIEQVKDAHDGMDDWRNWKPYDIVTCVIPPGRHQNYYETGKAYPVHSIDLTECQPEVQVSVICNSGFSLWCNPSCFKFHSRPTN